MFKYFFSIFLIPFSFLFSQSNSTFYQESKNNFLTTTKYFLESGNLDSTKIFLVTISPGITTSSAFGHSALRIQYNQEYDNTDFYVDFGQYDESLLFLWKFLRGNAGFYFSVVPTASAYETWDASGRGFLVSELNMNKEAKVKMLTEILKLFDTIHGYEYNNFKSNCVTFVRDLIDHALNIKLDLSNSLQQKTGREIAVRFSNRNLWLRIEEKLLFDHDTDKEKASSDRIFLPLDLQISVEDAKIIKETKQLIPDRWKTEPAFDYPGYIAFILFIFTVVSQSPKGVLINYKRHGQVIYSLLSGLGGSFALLVFLVTNFDFMDENIVVLVFTPLDFMILKKKFSDHKYYNKYLFLRIFMLCIALGLRMTFYKQNIDFILFFGILAYNAIQRKIENLDV